MFNLGVSTACIWLKQRTDHLEMVSALGNRSMIEAMLEAANWAPTHGRTEPWRFVVLGRQAQEEMIDLTLKVCRLLWGFTYSDCVL